MKDISEYLEQNLGFNKLKVTLRVNTPTVSVYTITTTDFECTYIVTVYDSKTLCNVIFLDKIYFKGIWEDVGHLSLGNNINYTKKNDNPEAIMNYIKDRICKIDISVYESFLWVTKQCNKEGLHKLYYLLDTYLDLKNEYN